MLGRRQDIARLQSDFYRDQYRKMLRWLTVSICIVLVLVLCVIYMILVQPTPIYYGNTIDGKVLLMPEKLTT